MPHLTLDHSANLSADGDIGGLCRKLARCLAEQKAEGMAVYPLGGIRVRALVAEAWCIADGSVDAAYLHAMLKVGAGRPESTLRATGDAVFEVMKSHFAELYGRMGLALSLEMAEFSEAGTWKHNNLHARLRKVSA
jgi:5-carboxymethyl-2-hydroxymuconate isomerase